MKQQLIERNERIYREYNALIAVGAPKKESKHLFMCRYNLRSINSITNAIKAHEAKINH